MLRIAVIGDLHVIDAAAHGLCVGAAPMPVQAATASDRDRYHCFTERLLPALMAEVAAAKPDLVLHTGDLAETGYREPAGSRELAAGLRALQSIGAPVLLCRGNHDGDTAWPDICGPHARPRWDGPGLHILTLDYPAFAPVDALARLERDLAATVVAASRTGARVVLAAHAPAYTAARPFFTDPTYAQALRHIAARHPIDALFCGHTHNQAWSLHALPGGRRWLQVKVAAVGFPGVPPVPLASARAIDTQSRLLWGFLEDTAPGWNELIIDGPWATLRWHALGGAVPAEARWRQGGEVDLVRAPDQTPPWREALPPDRAITAARLHVAGYGGGEGRPVTVNGRGAGTLPRLASFAPRCTVPVPPDAVGHALQIEIATEPEDRLLVGALALAVTLDDGTTARTAVEPRLHATCDDWARWADPRLQRVPAGRPITAALAFGG